MKITKEKITALRSQMKAHNLDGYLIPKADAFQGEFVPPYAERLQWLTGFTGSAGAAVILRDKACVLSDARYTLQLENEVDGDVFQTADSTKTGAHGWLKENAGQGAVIGFDPWLYTPKQIEKIKKEAPDCALKPINGNLIDKIWQDQPAPPTGKIEIFPDKIAGRTFTEKYVQLASDIKNAGGDAAIITLPDSISWLLNIRGNDVACTPSVLSYAIAFADAKKPLILYINPAKITNDIKGKLSDKVDIVDISHIEKAIKSLTGEVLIDHTHAPIWFKTKLEEQGSQIIDAKDSCIAYKAIKTKSEQQAIKKTHILDGIAVTKFLYWLESASKNQALTEMAVAEKIKAFRAQNEAFRYNSFPTIAGYGENGAIVHYRATNENNDAIDDNDLLLIDSGGQYYKDEIAGTTDITRTIAIGTPSEEMRENFTAVLKGHIALAAAKFPEGTIGKQIDTLARAPLWAKNLDFAHGTGHGVGCFLAVHEDAASISPRGEEAFKAGMLISNEPGYYKTGAYGIRIENLVFVKEAGTCEATGKTMLAFETISLAPIDHTLIVTTMLSQDEKDWLNAYHAEVFDKLKNGLNQDEQHWLKTKTQTL